MRRSPLQSTRVTRVRDGDASVTEDAVVVEEPLEIRVAGETLAVTMRTPGADRELALGYLWAEGIVTSLQDVGSVTHCGRTGDEGRENTIDVIPAPGARLRLPDDEGARPGGSGGAVPGRRGTLITSACGVCGRRTVEDLLARCAPLPPSEPLSADAVTRCAAALRGAQPLFARTGGCHGAGLFTREGEPLATFEDVGRHNAVDKLVGSRLLAGALPAASQALVVSGRTSFEIVQKAVAAGIPTVIGISAPSSLAIEVARQAGVTLVGFARDAAFVVYAGAVAPRALRGTSPCTR